MSRNYRGRGNARGGRGRGNSPRVTASDVEAYLKSKAAQFPSLSEVIYGEGESSIANVLQKEVEYITSPITKPIMIIEDSDLKFQNDPWEIKRRYLDTYGYPLPDGKFRYYYEAMLQKTGCVEFTHTYEKGTKGPMTYSKAIIKKIITLDMWGLHPQRARTVYLSDNQTNPVQFNYWDYVDAWTNTFYYQNGEHRHSWFFKICPNFMENGTIIPNWFINWWQIFGPQQDYLPEPIQKEYQTFKILHPDIKGKSLPEGYPFFLFIKEISFPWIWKWTVQIEHNNGLPILARCFHYKWWHRGMDTENSLKEVISKNQHYHHLHKQKAKSADSNPFLNISKKIQEDNPSLKEEELVMKTMDFMKDQFFQTFVMPDDASMTSAKSAEESSNPFTCLAGEAQDPYEDDNISPTLGDFWDGITHQLMEQIRKGKKSATDDNN